MRPPFRIFLAAPCLFWVTREESKGVVELGDLKFLGEAKGSAPNGK